jgi:hypothetical protein
MICGILPGEMTEITQQYASNHSIKWGKSWTGILGMTKALPAFFVIHPFY